MAFCSKCGKELATDANFCFGCGTRIIQKKEGNQQGYDGEIHKCPFCGEIISSFESICHSCKNELRGAKGSNAVSELNVRLSQADSEKEKIEVIKNFPIPNTREDIFEFAILASSNFDETIYRACLNEEDISDAWLAKIKQCKQKASLTFSEQADLEQINNICNDIIERAEKIKKVGIKIRQKEENKEKKNKWITLLLCILMGGLGAHKFYEGKIGKGVLYMFTGGLFFIGIFIDLVKILGRPTYYII